MSESIAMLPQV